VDALAVFRREALEPEVWDVERVNGISATRATATALAKRFEQ
jgi:hypothetical protein